MKVKIEKFIKNNEEMSGNISYDSKTNQCTVSSKEGTFVIDAPDAVFIKSGSGLKRIDTSRGVKPDYVRAFVIFALTFLVMGFLVWTIVASPAQDAPSPSWVDKDINDMDEEELNAFEGFLKWTIKNDRKDD